MTTHRTVIFADLTGSTGVFEALGNEKATLAVTRLTQLIGETCTLFNGRVVKTLGDGVLAVFPAEFDAVSAVVELQRAHQNRIAKWPTRLLMHLKVGMANGEIIQVDGDCFGEAVNLASRLSDLAGPGEIWATRELMLAVDPPSGVRFRELGLISIRGLTEPRALTRIDWNTEGEPSSLMTMPASLDVFSPNRMDSVLGQIELSWLDVRARFSSERLPVNLGRQGDVEFAVNDPRVSRLHARIDWVNQHFVLTDLSSYGTWVRFAGSSHEVTLRRGECVLLGQGDISLGAPFSDFTAPTVSFLIFDGAMALAHQARA